jgi:hypothetical protein
MTFLTDSLSEKCGLQYTANTMDMLLLNQLSFSLINNLPLAQEIFNLPELVHQVTFSIPEMLTHDPNLSPLTLHFEHAGCISNACTNFKNELLSKQRRKFIK